MDSQNFCREITGGIIGWHREYSGRFPQLYTLAGLHLAGCYSRSYQRSGSARCNRGRDGDFQGFARSLHYVASPGSVDVHIDKTGHHGSPARLHLPAAARGNLTFPRCPMAEILSPRITITASSISSKGVNARLVCITIGCIWTGVSYLKPWEIGNRDWLRFFRCSVPPNSKWFKATFSPVHDSC